MELLVYSALLGGLSVTIGAVICLAKYVYDQFFWNNIELTPKEEKQLREAIAEEYPTSRVVSTITGKRGFTFKRWHFNKATGKFRVK